MATSYPDVMESLKIPVAVLSSAIRYEDYSAKSSAIFCIKTGKTAFSPVIYTI
jgi:hypothetical protein